METEPDFYIGWQSQAPPATRKAVRRAVIILAVVVPVLAVLLVWQQRGFSGAVFEYGTQTTLEGQLIRYPVPFLRMAVPGAAGDNPVFERVLLIGLGKHGADATLQRWEDKHGDLAGKQLRMKGTLIYYEGKTALELTDGAGALLGVTTPGTPQPVPAAADLGLVTLLGEITDPKCMLGVMKPGDGRPHRSCAVRCIAGGIPPILYVSNGGQRANYYLVLGAQGQPVNQEILPHVGRSVRLVGRLEQVDNWLLLHTRSVEPLAALPPEPAEQLTLCH